MIGEQLVEVWRARGLFRTFVERNIAVRYKQAAIGLVWAGLTPLAMTAILALVVGRLLQLPIGDVEPLLFFMPAVLVWQYFAKAVNDGTACLVGNQNLISKVYFPRLVLPAAYVAEGLFDLAIGFALLLALCLVFGHVPSWTVVFAPAFAALAVLAAFAVVVWTSALTAVFRDVRFAVPFLVQIGMFATPVLYPASVVPEAWQWVLALNPVATAIEGMRWAVVGGPAPAVTHLLAGVGVSLLAAVTGLVHFRAAERRLADVI